jgi:hypothetical protein
MHLVDGVYFPNLIDSFRWIDKALKIISAAAQASEMAGYPSERRFASIRY